MSKRGRNPLRALMARHEAHVAALEDQLRAADASATAVTPVDEAGGESLNLLAPIEDTLSAMRRADIEAELGWAREAHRYLLGVRHVCADCTAGYPAPLCWPCSDW